MTPPFFEYPEPVERGAAAGDRVCYELSVRRTKAARLRVFDAICEHHAAVTSTHSLLADCLTLLVWIKLEKSTAFRDDVKPDFMRYRSPATFDNGTMVPVFRSPDAELADRQARREALRAQQVLAGLP